MWTWKFLGRELEMKAGLGRDSRSRREGEKGNEGIIHTFVRSQHGHARTCAGRWVHRHWQDASNVWMIKRRQVGGVEIPRAGH